VQSFVAAEMFLPECSVEQVRWQRLDKNFRVGPNEVEIDLLCDGDVAIHHSLAVEWASGQSLSAGEPQIVVDLVEPWDAKLIAEECFHVIFWSENRVLVVVI
jgi:hypothetical protein